MAASRRKALEGVQAIFERFHIIAAAKKYDGFDSRLMREAKLLDASIGPPNKVMTSAQGVDSPSILSSAVFSVKISEPYGNINGVMHGAAAALIYDMMTTSALGPLAKPGYWDFLGGVTRSLNISYLRAVEIGTTVHVHCHVHQVGRTMAFIRGFMTSEDGKIVFTTCEHHKVNVPPREGIYDYPVAWDEQWKTAKDRQKGSGAKL